MTVLQEALDSYAFTSDDHPNAANMSLKFRADLSRSRVRALPQTWLQKQILASVAF